MTGRIGIAVVDKEFTKAYAIGVLPFSKTILISKDLFDRMRQTELEGIVAHELGHLKQNHLFKLYLASLLALMIGYVSSIYFHPILEAWNYNIHVLRAIHGAVFYGVPIWLLPGLFQRLLEYKADTYAAGMVGKKPYVESLIKLDEITKGGLTRGGGLRIRP